MLKKLAVALIAATMITAPALAAGSGDKPMAPTAGAAAPTTGSGTAATGDSGKTGAHKAKTPRRHVVRHVKRGKHYVKHGSAAKLAKHASRHGKPHKMRLSHRTPSRATSAARSGT